MNRYLWVILASISFAKLHAQEIGISINYQFLEAKEWNKATQVYNFSRPFLKNKQPLLSGGLNVGFYYLKHPENTLSWGPSLTFSRHRSYSENPNFNIGIHSLTVDLGAKIQYRPVINEKGRGYLSLTPSLAGVALSRKLNDEIIIVGEPEDGEKMRKFGFGFGINAQIGYDFLIKKHFAISPTLGVLYHPVIWTSRGEVVFNEAAAGDLTSRTSMLSFQAGMVLKKRKN